MIRVNHRTILVKFAFNHNFFILCIARTCFCTLIYNFKTFVVVLIALLYQYHQYFSISYSTKFALTFICLLGSMLNINLTRCCPLKKSSVRGRDLSIVDKREKGFNIADRPSLKCPHG